MWFSTWSDSPYLNHFTQPDTIIPSPENPQSWNRYSYVGNNPIRYSDPTGHMRVADEDLQLNKASMNCSKYSQYCNSGQQISSEELTAMRTEKEKQQEKAEEHLRVSKNLTYGYTLSGTGGPMPDYYGEGEYSDNVPYIPEVSPGQGLIGPNPCQGGAPAYALCVLSLISSVVPPANQPGDPSHNFFLSLNVTYEEGIGVTVSNIQYLNRYGGDAVFESLFVNNTRVQKGDSYMPRDGNFHAVDNSGPFTSNRSITIDGLVQTIVGTPNGLGTLPFLINIQIPSGLLNP